MKLMPLVDIKKFTLFFYSKKVTKDLKNLKPKKAFAPPSCYYIVHCSPEYSPPLMLRKIKIYVSCFICDTLSLPVVS